MLNAIENGLGRIGKRIYPVYAVLLCLLALLLLVRSRDPLIAQLAAFHFLEILLLLALCIGILRLGFPSSQLGYVSFDRVTQAGLIWFAGPTVSALFNAVGSLVFPFFIRKRTGQSIMEAAIRALHNVGMMILVILAGGWAFRIAGGEAPVTALDGDVILPVVATILGMQITNGLLVRIRVALTDARLRHRIDWFANGLESAAALIGLLSAVIVATTDASITLAYLVLLLGLMATVKSLSDRRQSLEEMVSERTAQIEAQNQRLEEARARQDELVRRLDRLSREDDLTGLANRRHVNEFLARERDRALRLGSSLCIALVDLDHFKQINDRHSHQVGDAVLQKTAEVLIDGARSTDMVGRYGGEEFLVVFPDTDLVGARAVAERLRRDLADADWRGIAEDLEITLSAGLAELDADGNIDRLLHQADACLYRAKELGRNRVVSESARQPRE